MHFGSNAYAPRHPRAEALLLAGRPVTSLQQNHFKSAHIVLKKRDDDVQHEPGARRYRAIFVSDLHLSTKACQAEAFLDFLRCHDAPRIYLIGDIVDFWRIKRGIYWRKRIT